MPWRLLLRVIHLEKTPPRLFHSVWCSEKHTATRLHVEDQNLLYIQSYSQSDGQDGLNLIFSAGELDRGLNFTCSLQIDLL